MPAMLLLFYAEEDWHVETSVDRKDMGSEPSGPFGLWSAQSRFVLIVAVEVALYSGPVHYPLSAPMGYLRVFVLILGR
jgi:hypothetical protein